MSETFGEKEGLFWGDEHSADIWVGRGVNIAAEDAILEGDVVVSNNARRYKGSGFVKFDNKEGAKALNQYYPKRPFAEHRWQFYWIRTKPYRLA